MLLNGFQSGHLLERRKKEVGIEPGRREATAALGSVLRGCFSGPGRELVHIDLAVVAVKPRAPRGLVARATRCYAVKRGYVLGIRGIHCRQLSVEPLAI